MTKVSALAVLAAAAFCTAAGAAGPSPGVMFGGTGVAAPNGNVRYVAMSNGSTTVVQTVAAQTGRVVRWTWLQGSFGVPIVAFDGQTEGLTADGRTLVVAPFLGQTSATATTFVLLDTRRLKVKERVTLRGQFSFDAMSPDGKTLYLIEYQSQDGSHYLVRAYDVAAHRLLATPVADAEEKGPMTGAPITRVRTASGSWAYTLYASDHAPFVHALDTVHRKAVCVDLPESWKDTQSLFRVRMSLVGSKLVLRQSGVGQLASIDTRTFEVQTYRQPARR